MTFSLVKRTLSAASCVLAATAILAGTIPGDARAAPSPAASPWHDNPYTSVRLISALDGTGNGTAGASANASLRFGLEFRMEEDWKIYWRSPGDAGYPPETDWSGSTNVAAVDMSWPAPARFSVLGLETLGYEDAVVFPLDVTPTVAGEPIRLSAEIDYLACSDICVPEQASVSLELPGGDGNITRYAHEINRFAALVPSDGAAHGLAIERPMFDAGETPTLSVQARSVSGMEFGDPDVYVEGPQSLSFGKPAVTLANGGMEARFVIPIYAPNASDVALVGENVTLTLVDGMRNAEATLNVAAGDGKTAPVQAARTSGGLGLAIIGLAFLGGLILNLMPCVLPVLSIKLAGVVSHGGGSSAHVRRGFIASAAGIVTAFVLLAGALAALKASGMAIGWGIQFQQPLFLAIMAAVVTLFACNLAGWFNIRLPAAIAGLGTPTGKPDRETPLTGHFMTGMLATVLATPCSAPFLGTAVGFALARGPFEIVGVFIFIGIGLAAPYLLVAAVPRIVTMLPRPGRWMIRLRQAMAVALALTAVWLLSVLATGSGTTVAIVTGAALAAAAFGLWLGRRSDEDRRSYIQPAAAMMFAVAVLLPVIEPDIGTLRSPALDSDSPSGNGSIWQTFDRDAIEPLVYAGTTVLIDVTADWCLTCKVNKSVALGDPAVQMKLNAPDVTAMVADWTLPDPEITDYLASFERYGIPFNVVYGPGAPGGIVLPELLRANDVLEAMERAGGVGKSGG